MLPCLKLTVPSEPFGFGTVGFQPGEYVVMRIVGSQVKAEVETSRVQQPQQRGKGGLPLVTLISRDHRDRDSRSFGQFPLAHTRLQASELQQRRRRRRQPFSVVRLCHNTIV